MAAALLSTCGQTGVGVAGGIMVGVTTMAAMTELDPSKFVLNEDIRNMFNELDRCSMMEDLLDSAELIGEDFSGLAPYAYMAYFGDYINWFRVVEADTTGLGEGGGGRGGRRRGRE